MLGRQVELKVLDDGFDQKTAISDYTKLIGQDKVDLVLGTFSSDLNLAVAPIAERYNYVYVEPSGGADEIFERGFKYLFFAQPATTKKLPEQFVKMIEEAPEDQRPKTVAFVTAEDPNTTPARGDPQGDLEALGLETVHSATYAADASNFDAIANAVKQANPDLVVNGSIAQDGIQLIRSFQKLGFSPDMLYQTNTPTDPAFAEAIGQDNTEGILTYLAYSAEAELPGQRRVRRRLREGVRRSAERGRRQLLHGRAGPGRRGRGRRLAGPGRDRRVAAHQHRRHHRRTAELGRSRSAPRGTCCSAQFQDGELEVIGPPDAATTQEIIYEKPAVVTQDPR